MLVKVNSYAAYSHNYSRYSFTRFFISIKIKSHMASLESQTKGSFITFYNAKKWKDKSFKVCSLFTVIAKFLKLILFLIRRPNGIEWLNMFGLWRLVTLYIFYVKSVKTSFLLPVLHWLIKSYRISQVKG